MSNNNIIDLYLLDELEASYKLIELGFGEFQNISSINNFYFLPFQLLSSGFERLMKCHCCFGYYQSNNEYPSFQRLKGYGGKNGHDLLDLKKAIITYYFKTNNIVVLEEDYQFLMNDKDLETLVSLLSEFGKYARYHNFDVITSKKCPSINVKALWEEYESDIISGSPELLEKQCDFEKSSEVGDYVRRNILITLEKFARAVSRQFTIGKLGAKAKKYSGALLPFIVIRDEELGTKNYRLQTTRYKEIERKPHKRTLFDEVQRNTNKHYRHKLVRKDDFQGDWPFYSNEVVIESREKHWCVVTVGNTDYALNGSAQNRYKLESAHDAGMAIIGKSVSPFIDMALKLGESA